MTLNGAIMQLVEMRMNSMMPEVFKPYLDKVIETVSECEEPSMIPERKKGKWEVCDILDYAQRPSGRKILRCPFCGYLTDEFRSRVDYYHKLTHFCPNCGADMSGEQE